MGFLRVGSGAASVALAALMVCGVRVMVAQQPYGQYGPGGGQGYGQYGGYRNDPAYARGYQDGFNSGRTDLERGKRNGDPVKSENYEETPGYNSSYGSKDAWKQMYRQAYVQGYQQGMQGGNGPGNYGQGPAQRGYGQGGYGQGPYGGDPAAAKGFQDGFNTGRADLQRGKMDGDPVKGENYEETPGYNSSYGPKDQWKQQYRQAYVDGYRQGLSGGYGNGPYGAGNYGGGQRYPEDGRQTNGPGYGERYRDDPAYRAGFEDGMSDGRKDVARNKRNADITKSDRYGETPGYNSSYGPKDQWKEVYRQGYTAGYERAWGPEYGPR